MDFDKKILSTMNRQASKNDFSFESDWELAMRWVETESNRDARYLAEARAVLIGTAGAVISSLGLAWYLIRIINLPQLLTAIP